MLCDVLRVQRLHFWYLQYILMELKFDGEGVEKSTHQFQKEGTDVILTGTIFKHSAQCLFQTRSKPIREDSDFRDVIKNDSGVFFGHRWSMCRAGGGVGGRGKRARGGSRRGGCRGCSCKGCRLTWRQCASTKMDTPQKTIRRTQRQGQVNVTY